MPYILMDPGELLDFTFSWEPFLEEGGSPSDTLLSASWSITPANAGSPSEPAITGELVSGVLTTCFVNGVLRGVVYRLTCRATTSMGRISEQSITLRGGER